MKNTVVLALVLVVSIFAITIATATIDIPEINTLDRTFSIVNVVPCGDPIGDGGPPGLRNQTPGNG